MARIRKRQWGLLLLGTVCTIFVFYSLQKRQANENNRHTINGKNEIVFSAPQCQLSEEEIAELPYTQWRDYLLRTLNADLNDTLLKYLPQELSLDRAEKSKLLALDVGAGAGLSLIHI